jgi:cobalamin biosynthesis Co2+ chelatase CbiK
VSRIFEEFHYLAIQTKIVQHFGGFFHKIKVRQPIGSEDSIKNRAPNKQEVAFIFVCSGSELKSLLKYSKLKYWYYSNAGPIWPDGTFKKSQILT